MRFFDHNATSPMVPAAREAWLEAQDAFWLNPSSPYRAAARVRVRLDQAREELAGLLGVDDPARIVFNSGATEGNNAVFAHWSSVCGGGPVLVGPTEHPSVLEAAHAFFPNAWRPLPLGPGGAIDPAGAEELLRSGGARAVSAMAANNETGLLNDWRELAGICRRAGAAFHCDASQWIGRLPLDGFGGAGYVTACAHKFGGPRGTGFLLLPSGGAGGFAGLRGGAHESGHRAGTEDVAGVLAMLAALRERSQAVAAGGDPAAGRDRFEKKLTGALPEVRVVGAGQPRLWNTSCVVMPPPESPRWIRALERRGFLVSAGSACSTGKEGPSHVLAALGLPADAMRRTLRISSGPETNAGDWSGLLAALLEASAEFASGQEGPAGSSRVIRI